MTHVGWLSNAGRPFTWKPVLEQLRNRITGCLNRPLRDALSFPAGKADQSQLSSPWSRGEIEMWVDRFGTEWKVKWVEKWQDREVFFSLVWFVLCWTEEWLKHREGGRPWPAENKAWAMWCKTWLLDHMYPLCRPTCSTRKDGRKGGWRKEKTGLELIRHWLWVEGTRSFPPQFVSVSVLQELDELWR